MNDIKLFVKNEKNWKTLFRQWGYSQEIKMGFRREKYAMQIMKSGKWQIKEGLELPNEKKKQGPWRKVNLQILGNQTSEDERKKLKRGERENTLETKLHCRNIIKEINTWGNLLVRFSGPFLKWRKELQWMDQRTRNSWRCIRPFILDMTYAHYMCPENVDTLIRRLQDYIKSTDWSQWPQAIQTT